MPEPDWTPRRRIEQEYRSLILRLLDQYLSLPEAATLGEIVAALADWARVSALLERAATGIAARMVTQVKARNARSWREAARKGGRGPEVYAALRREMETEVGDRVQELVRANAALISSIPEEIREQANLEISRMEEEGLRPEEIAGYLQARVPELTRSRAQLIARTETGKSVTALTRARSEELGIDWFEWATSRDERVRPSHRKMQGVLASWNDLPSPERLIGEKSVGTYGPGEIWNCRCSAWPILRLSNLSWPKKVYADGRIRSMTRAAFARRFLAGTEAKIYP
jgi:SPP1 gp7 family putative phage head morphogenesis protein